MTRLSDRKEAWAYPTITFVLLAALWQWAVVDMHAAIPSPVSTIAALMADPRFFAENAAITLFEAVAGLLLAIVTALAVSSLFAVSGMTRKALAPLVVATQTLPLVAIAPLLVPIIGDGEFSIIVVSAWLCWFPALVSALHGMLRLDPAHEALFQIYGARKSQIFWKLRVPQSLYSVIAGVRASAGFAMIGAIVAEYSGAKQGLGAVILKQSIYRTDESRLYAVILIASLAGVALTEGAFRLSRLAVARYAPSTG